MSKAFFSVPTGKSSSNSSSTSASAASKKEPHIKKPLNAFMLYMKEMRPVVQAECTLKESAAINQILGRRVKKLDSHFRTDVNFCSSLCKALNARNMQCNPWQAPPRPSLIVVSLSIVYSKATLRPSFYGHGLRYETEKDFFSEKRSSSVSF